MIAREHVDVLMALFSKGWVGTSELVYAITGRTTAEVHECCEHLQAKNMVNRKVEDFTTFWRLSPKGKKFLRSGFDRLSSDLESKVHEDQIKAVKEWEEGKTLELENDLKFARGVAQQALDDNISFVNTIKEVVVELATGSTEKARQMLLDALPDSVKKEVEEEVKQGD